MGVETQQTDNNMTKPANDLAKPATVIEIEPNALEMKSVKQSANSTSEMIEKKSTDEIDQGCVKCIPKEITQTKENVSLSSSDDETEQVISSLNMSKKPNTIAYKGMMDIALLTANANQLRFLITYNSEEKTFIISAALIILSLIVQVAVGIGMIFKRQMKRKGNSQKADKVGSLLISGIFCLAVLNVLVVSFTTTTTIKSQN